MAEYRYTALRADAILTTLEKLENRIGERFPDSGLWRVCREFRELAAHTESLALDLARPHWPLRLGAFAAAGLLVFVGLGMFIVLLQNFRFNTHSIPELLTTTESAINELIFLGLALVFLTSLETRLKRRKALRALHALRSIAHVVDMHQLTKDPAHLLAGLPDTQSSPERKMDRYKLARYLDYCSEILALNSKIAALFAQNMDDTEVLRAVNDLDNLIQGLSSKIWQKIMILDLAEQQPPC
jgi:hypothetical protein